jgi:ribosomal protein S12
VLSYQVPSNVVISMGDLPGIAFKTLAGLLQQFRARTAQRNRRSRLWHKRR